MAEALYLGLISGTSADGIDAALLRFGTEPHILSAHTYPYPEALRVRILALARSSAQISLDNYGALDVEIGAAFAAAAQALLETAGIDPTAVRAIGSHGQTICHRPAAPHPFTLQIGDPSVIAERTGIVTIADFRRGDVAAGGQGAPLAPAFHASAFAPRAPCAVLNLGGIANVTLIGADGSVRGFDTGPANCLMDAWAARHLGQMRDAGGAWAAGGTVEPALLAGLLDDPYFALPAPKSTGREYFNLDWLDARLPAAGDARNVQATLLALSVHSIAAALDPAASGLREVLVCGGGVHNAALMAALGAALAPATVHSTAAAGVDPDFVEAATFAWLARERLDGRPGNLPAVTGARGPRVLGAIHPGGAR
ncbi:MAG: anhydro-N-acetylmuramic acid kinase [Rhodanobacter denitrificans]|uniref:Anhydro-N-acetylmuramic acid kinase n=1 Tax=Rhodanobacter denitrificans TaxID=666685 RepID=A0A2W5JZA9_9GAMM|nr:MAG: anhydro-N-acetylmuramic acid kinase [Rhodanobacter denitrificans]